MTLLHSGQFAEATVTVPALLSDAAHESVAFVTCLCASRHSSQALATFHESDLCLLDANLALFVCFLPLLILCLCRKPSVIVIADIASTSLVMLWLTYIIHVTLKENQEDAQNILQPARISEFLKVKCIVLLLSFAASQGHAVSPCMSLMVTMHLRCYCKLQIVQACTFDIAHQLCIKSQVIESHVTMQYMQAQTLHAMCQNCMQN